MPLSGKGLVEDGGAGGLKPSATLRVSVADPAAFFTRRAPVAPPTAAARRGARHHHRRPAGSPGAGWRPGAGRRAPRRRALPVGDKVLPGSVAEPDRDQGRAAALSEDAHAYLAAARHGDDGEHLPFGEPAHRAAQLPARRAEVRTVDGALFHLVLLPNRPGLTRSASRARCGAAGG